MILPTKHLPQDRALLSVGARILENLGRPKTISALWGEIAKRPELPQASSKPMSFDGFVLALDLLFLLGAIDLNEGLLTRKQS